MTMTLTLVHSPLVGPMTWEQVATAARGRGYLLSVPDLTVSLSNGPPYARRQIDAVAEAAGQGPAVLVGHSGAGPLLAAAASACDAIGCVFVDAGLPNPGHSWFDTAPADLAAQLRSMARSGLLPPWPQWWEPEELEALLPDPLIRERFAAGCPSLPLAMFDEPMPPSPGWEHEPAAYLQLSDAYQESVDQARALGWPVVTMSGHHLSMLSHPDLVIEPLLQLVGRLSV